MKVRVIVLSSLINASGPALGMTATPAMLQAAPGSLRELYDWRNGFRGFDGALLVLPLESTSSLPGLAEWNALDGWRRWYDVSAATTFFAMDVLLNQYGVTRSGAVERLDAVTGEVTRFARDVDAWAVKVSAGEALARDWQRLQRPLFSGERLFSRVSGSVQAANLVAVDLRVGIEALGAQLGAEVEHGEHSGEHFVADLCSMAW